MVGFLMKVKMNNIVLMAIKDSSWPGHWTDPRITYVDRFGSETHKNDRMKGCPFTMC